MGASLNKRYDPLVDRGRMVCKLCIGGTMGPGNILLVNDNAVICFLRSFWELAARLTKAHIRLNYDKKNNDKKNNNKKEID